VKTLWQQSVAEIVGTFALVFIGAGSVVVIGGLVGTPGIVGVALAHGLVLAIMISNLGHISGGHFNPAVTIGVWVVGKIESARALVYIGSQLAGATIGALLLRLALPAKAWVTSSLGASLVILQLDRGSTTGRPC
jgi:glycerol uptake facilitator-like aquaporin